MGDRAILPLYQILYRTRSDLPVNTVTTGKL
jgi:hypothetical protein